eukprot:CCRYP_005762-RA/>CCRYP_005762-RA protein AED:0.11 eAED:0.11 QI:0/0/0.5/0.5/0/0/2/609/268
MTINSPPLQVSGMADNSEGDRVLGLDRELYVEAIHWNAIKDKVCQSSTNSSWHISNISTTREMKQHLFLLFHAQKCPLDEDTACPAMPQCAEAKRIWKHIATCQNKTCSYCYPSRYVLTHYRECKDAMCQICGPVRGEIQRRRQQGQISKTNTGTFSTSPSTTTPNIKEYTGVAVTPDPNHMPTLTVAICRSADNVGRIIPVRRGSFSSYSSVSGCSSAFSSNLSTRSCAPSNRSAGSGHPPRAPWGGIKCRDNLGIAHFSKDNKKEP